MPFVRRQGAIALHHHAGGSPQLPLSSALPPLRDPAVAILELVEGSMLVVD